MAYTTAAEALKRRAHENGISVFDLYKDLLRPPVITMALPASCILPGHVNYVYDPAPISNEGQCYTCHTVRHKYDGASP